MALPKQSFATIIVLIFSITTLWFTRGISSPDEFKKGDEALTAEQSQRDYGLIQDCLHKFKGNCGELTYSKVVFNNATVTPVCCRNLVVDVGKKCFDYLIIPIIESNAFKKNASEISKNNKEVWNKCSLININ